MAFKSNVSTEGNSFKLFTGVASCYVRGVNFNKKEIEEFFGRELQNEPDYIGDGEVDGKSVKEAHVKFFVEVEPNKYKDAEGNPISLKSQLMFTLRRIPKVGSSSGKIQIIDKYGRTAWGLPNEVENNKIPMYANGPANISEGYRKAYTGEEDLINFLIAYLNIPGTVKKENGKWVSKTANELEECEASLENIEDYFKGNFSELKDICVLQPENKVKLLFGIKTTDEGKQFQTIFGRMFLKNGVHKYDKLDAEVQNFLQNTTSNIVYEVQDLHEYIVEETNFASTDTNTDEDPFATPMSDAPWA